MERFGHFLDAFVRLREIAEQGDQSNDLREWAVAVAEMTGELENLKAAWTEASDVLSPTLHRI